MITISVAMMIATTAGQSEPPKVTPIEAISDKALAAGDEPVRALGDQGAWFPLSAYPPEARRRNEQGRVSVMLTIDPKGRPSACSVTSSSGSETLDKVTCDLAKRNARFRPARKNGAPVESTYALRGIRWMLNPTAEQTVEVGEKPLIVSDNMVEVELTPNGEVVGCKVVRQSSDTSPCAQMLVGKRVFPPITRAGHPVAARAQFATTVTLLPMDPTSAPK